MKIHTLSLLLFFILTLSPLFTSAQYAKPNDLVKELLTLQSNSPTGIIHLNDHLISRFLTSVQTPRPYTLLIFFDAVQLHDKPELHLRSLRTEFSLLSQSFTKNNLDNPDSLSKLFFCDLEFKESQSSFALFGVNTLPHVRIVAPNVKSPKESVQMDQTDLSRMAESMADFIESRTGLTVGSIHRPPIISKKHIGLIIAALLIWAPFAIKKVISGETMLHDRKIWLAGAVFVYFFSVAGTMHNIIRKMPMFLVDRNDPSKLVFFYQGSGMQLGAEGFAIGTLYTIVGLLLAGITHVLVRVRNGTVQRVFMLIAMFVAFWAVKEVVFLDNWKTGYGIHAYWPTSWS